MQIIIYKGAIEIRRTDAEMNLFNTWFERNGYTKFDVRSNISGWSRIVKGYTHRGSEWFAKDVMDFVNADDFRDIQITSNSDWYASNNMISIFPLRTLLKKVVVYPLSMESARYGEFTAKLAKQIKGKMLADCAKIVSNQQICSDLYSD